MTVKKRKYLKKIFGEKNSSILDKNLPIIIVAEKHTDVRKYYNYKIEIQNCVCLKNSHLQDLTFALG